MTRILSTRINPVIPPRDQVYVPFLMKTRKVVQRCKLRISGFISSAIGPHKLLIRHPEDHSYFLFLKLILYKKLFGSGYLFPVFHNKFIGKMYPFIGYVPCRQFPINQFFMFPGYIPERIPDRFSQIFTVTGFMLTYQSYCNFRICPKKRAICPDS